MLAIQAAVERFAPSRSSSINSRTVIRCSQAKLCRGSQDGTEALHSTKRKDAEESIVIVFGEAVKLALG